MTRRVATAHVAQVLGLSKSALHRRLAGEVEFRETELQRLAELLGVPVSVLYGEQVPA